jgi:hypothetical protein
MTEKKAQQENPLTNLIINVLIPVVILSYLSKDPALQEKLHRVVRPWHLGPLKAMILALALPLGYGIWHFIKTRKGNLFSALGLVSILLSGGLTLYLWNADGTVKPNAGLLFGIKEGSIPLMLGVGIWLSGYGKNPLIRSFIYTDALFDVKKIENSIAERGESTGYLALMSACNKLFAASFFLSACLNVAVARWFFRSFNAQAADALEQYNQVVGKVTGWSFLIIGLPVIVVMFMILNYLLKNLRALTGLTDEELMLPR